MQKSHLTTALQNGVSLMSAHNIMQLDNKLPSIEDQGQTDRECYWLLYKAIPNPNTISK